MKNRVADVQPSLHRVGPLDGLPPPVKTLSADDAEVAVLRREAALYRAACEHAPDYMVMVDRERRFIWANRAHPSLTMDELLTKRIDDFQTPDNLAQAVESIERCFQTGQPVTFQGHYEVHGEEGWTQVRCVYLSDRDAVLIVTTHVTDEVRMRLQLEDALSRQTVLLKEVHHRVKNNLQVVASLLGLQGARIADEGLKRAVQSCRDRVHTMALVHEHLYQQERFASVSFGNFLESLVSQLMKSVGLRGPHRVVLGEVVGVSVPLDVAIPCGLIVNELVSNALSHAFDPGRRGTVRLDLRRRPQGTLVLEVSDDGCGFDREQAATRGSLGLRLVETLASQIDADLSVSAEAGTRVVLEIPIADAPAPSSRVGTA